jgi:hypothetical protein
VEPAARRVSSRKPPEADDTIAQAIGMAVAYYTGQILEPMLAGIAERLDKLIAQQQSE